MPVHLSRDDEIPQIRRTSSSHADLADMRSSLLAGARAALTVLLPAGVVLTLALRALAPSLIAADKLLKGEGDHWQEMWMPAVLLGFLGLLTGPAFAWRVSASASLGSTTIWMVIVVGLAALTIVGSVTAVTIFTSAVPIMSWIGLSFFAAGTLLGAYLFTSWAG
jgi:hypothetical protein